MNRLNQQKYQLRQYTINPIFLNRNDLKKMVVRIKKNKFNRISADDYEWNYRFEKNCFLFCHKKLKTILLSVPLEKDGDDFIIKYIWAYPNVENYFKFEFMLEATTLEEKLTAFIQGSLDLFSRKISPDYNISRPKRLNRVKVSVDLKYSIVDFRKIKDAVVNKKYDAYGWAYIFKKNWLCIFHVGMGFLIKAQFEKEESYMIIRKAFIWPETNKFLMGDYASKESLPITAKKIIKGHIESIMSNYDK